MTTDTSFTPLANLELQLLGLWNKFLNRSDLTIDDDFLRERRRLLVGDGAAFRGRTPYAGSNPAGYYQVGSR